MPWPCDQTTITYSGYLTNLNNNNAKEGTYLFSAWSLGIFLFGIQHFLADDVILYEDNAWARPTSLIRNSTGFKQYDIYTHMETKELTAADQYNMVVYHTIS